MTTLIVNIGYRNMELYHVVDRKLVYARTVNFGLSSIIKSISVNLDISPTKAIQFLYTYGLKKDALDGKLFDIVNPGINVFGSELEKSIRYITSRDIFNAKDGTNLVKRIVFMGGGSMIPNVLTIMSDFTSAELSLANSWGAVNIQDVTNVSALDKASPLFSVAVGAAMK